MEQLEMPTDKAKVSAYIDRDLKKKVDLLADVRERSISYLVEVGLRKLVADAESSGELKTEGFSTDG